MSVQGALNLASIEGNDHQKRQQSTFWKLVLDHEGWFLLVYSAAGAHSQGDFLQPCPSERAKEYIQDTCCHHFDLAWFCQHHGSLVDHVHATFQHH